MDFEDAEDLYVGEDEEQNLQESAPQKDEIILLIDCSESMHQLRPTGESAFHLVLNAGLKFLKNKILTSDSDNIGVIFFNTQTKNNHMNFENLCVLQELAPPDAPRIKQIQDLLKQQRNLWGSKEGLFVEALWLCHDMLAQNKNPANRRILIFTDEDRPNALRKNEVQRAIQRARDLAQQDIIIELYPLNKVDRAFDFNSFYIQIIPVDETEADEPINGLEKLDELEFKMFTKEYKKRKLGTINLALCPGMTISMNYYCTFREAKKPTPSKLHQKDNKKLKTVTSWICQESGKQLWPHEVGNHYELGNTKVKFNKEDVAAIKSFDAPGMKLMGFKDKARVKNYMNVRASYFLYPDEGRVKGSGQVVRSLLVSMEKLEKVAIVRFIPRQGSIVRFAALFPSLEPQGFNVIFMPYADDMRNPETLKAKDELPEVPEETVTAAKAMISKIQLGEFDVKSYYNPALQHFYVNLEALALEDPAPPPILDSLMPDEEGMQKHEEDIKRFYNTVFEGCNKRPPRNDRNPAQGEQYTEAELKKMKVNDLKEICDRIGISKTGKKDELIEKILNKL